MFHEIQQRVKEGRWEVIGGMWVEPDLNMPDGESLVRQILYGKRYFQQKFGVDVNIGWNPDASATTGNCRKSTSARESITSSRRSCSGPRSSPSFLTASSGGRRPTAAAC